MHENLSHLKNPNEQVFFFFNGLRKSDLARILDPMSVLCCFIFRITKNEEVTQKVVFLTLGASVELANMTVLG